MAGIGATVSIQVLAAQGRLVARKQTRDLTLDYGPADWNRSERSPSERERQGVKEYQHQRECGGEAAFRRYYAAAAAKMRAERLGSRTDQFLVLADKTDPAEIVAVLRGSLQAAVSEEAPAGAAASAAADAETTDEPLLPFGENFSGAEL